MRWEVRGASSHSGDDINVIIEAETRDSAERRAVRKGILVAEVLPLDSASSRQRSSVQVSEMRANRVAPLSFVEHPSIKWLFRVPSTFAELTGHLIAGWMAFGMLAFVISLFSRWAGYAALVFFTIATVAVVQQLWLLMRARQAVLSKKDISLCWGLVRLVAWDPIEGVLFLNNKSLGFYDDRLDDGCGGVRLTYPIFGEELALRIPLEIQTLGLVDENVLTREYLSVSIRGTVKWRIVDIKSFYLLVSRDLRNTSDRNDGRLLNANRSTAIGDQDARSAIDRLVQSAITWLRLIAEEQTRAVVSQVNSGLLIAERLQAELPEVKDAFEQNRSVSGPRSNSGDWQVATNNLAAGIEEALKQRVNKFGILIEDVSLQEVRLPEAIVEQCIKACKAAYLPLLAQREALADRAKLAAEVDLIGRDAAATKEILSVAPAIALGDFLTQFVAKQLGDHSSTVGAVASASLAAAALTQGVSSPPSLPS